MGKEIKKREKRQIKKLINSINKIKSKVDKIKYRKRLVNGKGKRKVTEGRSESVFVKMYRNEQNNERKLRKLNENK